MQPPVRRVLRVVERAIGAGGQHLFVPDDELDGLTTTMKASLDAAAVIAQCADDATYEQLHAEFKTDMDLARLPSGKSNTNALVCRLAALALDIRRLIWASAEWWGGRTVHARGQGPAHQDRDARGGSAAQAG